jgi:hypothetical protein
MSQQERLDPYSRSSLKVFQGIASLTVNDGDCSVHGLVNQLGSEAFLLALEGQTLREYLTKLKGENYLDIQDNRISLTNRGIERYTHLLKMASQESQTRISTRV